MTYSVYAYTIVMALVTYAIRVLPLVLFKREIKSRFLRSFLYYVPFSCLAAMTMPAILTAPDSMIAGAVGLAAALFAAYREKSLLTVALVACGAVFLTERLLSLIGGTLI